MYGFAEGKWHGKALRQALQTAGLEITKDCTQADRIIAHSGGSLIIPGNTRAKVTLQINPTWPNQPYWRSFAQKIFRDLRAHKKHRQLRKWLVKTAWNTIYILGNMPRNWQMLKNSRHIEKLTPTPTTIVIRNRHDPWCSPEIVDAIQNKNVTYISLPGEHDDLWDNPKPYVNLLQLEA